MKYQNPILPGFYPDPSLCRVGEDYFLATSSFEYFPGVPIFQSRDLVNWRQIGHALTRESQLPLPRGTKCSDGIYAPTLRHHSGRFYLATTIAISGLGFRNFFVTTEDPAGEWSDPIWVEQGGIDPSLHFAEDGDVYWTGNGTGWAATRGIYQSRIDIATGQLQTKPELIWTGTGGSYPEAPHLFRRGDFYYLTVAEGGTAEGHMVTVARARQPFGPFESCLQNPVLSHRSRMSPIQATGHADFFVDPQGDWWCVFLGIRYGEGGFQNLGRETFLAPVEWTETGWPCVNAGRLITLEMEVNRARPEHRWPALPTRDDFTSETLALAWVFLRNPPAGSWSLSERPGSLRLSCLPGTLAALERTAFIGRRQQHFACRVATLIDFEPATDQEEAGLIVMLDATHHAELIVTRRLGAKVVVLRRQIGSLIGESQPIAVDAGPLELVIVADRKIYQFRVVAMNGGKEETVSEHELRYVSTQVAGGYTGVMLGLWAGSNGTESTNRAYFDWFDYEPVG